MMGDIAMIEQMRTAAAIITSLEAENGVSQAKVDELLAQIGALTREQLGRGEKIEAMAADIRRCAEGER